MMVTGSAALRGRLGERETLDRLIRDVQTGQSAEIVLRGEAGIGKTALLRYCAERASPECQVLQVAGVEAEFELPFAALHEVCAPMLGTRSLLPKLPSRDSSALELPQNVRPRPESERSRKCRIGCSNFCKHPRSAISASQPATEGTPGNVPGGQYGTPYSTGSCAGTV
jgi:AAA ATPase domain